MGAVGCCPHSRASSQIAVLRASVLLSSHEELIWGMSRGCGFFGYMGLSGSGGVMWAGLGGSSGLSNAGTSAH